MNKTWCEINKDFLIELSTFTNEAEIQSIFRLVVEFFTNQYPVNQKVLAEIVTDNEQTKVNQILQRLKNNEPIQYILGYAWFYDLKLNVTPSVLIPRQETEELVAWVVQTVKSIQNPQIIDFGSGSGAITLALANEIKQSKVTGVDISKEAIDIALQNAKKHQIENSFFLQDDMLHLNQKYQTFDCVVSNPPYILPSFRQNMEKQVTHFEPEIALFTPKNQPLLFYEAVADFGKKHLSVLGYLFFEINEFFVDEMQELVKNKGFHNVEVKKDLNGNWRMLKAQKV